MTPGGLAGAYALDLLLGDPEWFPHPVRGFGLLTQLGERNLRPFTDGPLSEFAAGAMLTISVTSIAWVAGCPRNPLWRGLLAWTTLATRSLLQESDAVLRSLEQGELVTARRLLARIVGRDTANLDSSEISRAVIETLAESTCDGIVAPLFWLALGGVPGAMAYKAINTLDSMIGHREPRYLYFGRAAARLDDAVNFVPARLTALLIVAAARLRNLGHRRALQVWARDADNHASPNAGQSEAAIAGALDVRLGGLSNYDGVPHDSALLHAEGREPSVQDARSAWSLVAVVSGLAFGIAFVALAFRRLK